MASKTGGPAFPHPSLSDAANRFEKVVTEVEDALGRLSDEMTGDL